MDTITQIALGAAVGQAVMGARAGRRAVAWGALCGLFPDLDVLIPFDDAVKAFTYHRGPSHSLFVLALLTPLFAWMALRVHKDTAAHRRRWHAMIYAAFATHVLLDCFTVYGTQVFWPLATPPVMWSTIFIIDPAYTLPLTAGVAAALLMRRHTARGDRLNTAGLIISALYLAWSVGVKLHVTDIVESSLARQNIPHKRCLTTPSPFNTVLWRVLAIDDNSYYEGFYSLFDNTDTIHFSRHASRHQLTDTIRDHWPVRRLQWFTHGFYSMEQRDNTIVMTDLRMGIEPTYVFRFAVAELDDPRPVPLKARRVHDKHAIKRLPGLWRRLIGDSHYKSPV